VVAALDRKSDIETTCAEIRRVGGNADAHILDITDHGAYRKCVDGVKRLNSEGSTYS